jgi:hypothetical protein
MGITFSRSVMAAVVAGGLALAMSAPASAASAGRVTVFDGTLRFQAGPDSVNDVRVWTRDNAIVVTDTATPLVASAPCVQPSPNTAICPGRDVRELVLVLGNLDDHADTSGDGGGIGSRNENLQGGRGNDILVGGPANSEIWGGPGNDEMHGNLGDDVLFGDVGADLLDGGAHVNGDFGNGGTDGDTDTCLDLETKVSCDQ